MRVLLRYHHDLVVPLRALILLQILTIMGAKDGALEPGLMNGLDKVCKRQEKTTPFERE
jgi:hypothetical protein